MWWNKQKTVQHSLVLKQQPDMPICLFFKIDNIFSRHISLEA